MKALFALEHAILIAVRNMLSTKELRNDPGPDYFSKLQPAKTRTRAISLLEANGYSHSEQQADPPDQTQAVPDTHPSVYSPPWPP